MAAMVFKLGLLTLKTAAKPLASRFESFIMGHPATRRRVIEMAQWLHRTEVGINRGAEGKTGRAFVAEMTEDNAVALASKVVSEGFLYGMGVVLVIVELQRKNKEETAKKEKEVAEKQAIRDLHERHLAAETELRHQLEQLGQRMERVDERLAFMEQSMGRRRSWLPLFG